jgi:hypothetical protein
MKTTGAASTAMTLQDESYLAEIAIALASIITCAVALWALLFARRQLKQAEDAATQMTQGSATERAVATYRSLLEKALEYPDFIVPDPALVNTKDKTFNGSKIEFRRYEAFVDLMLTTFEGTIWLSIKEGITESYILQWLRDHHTYLLSDYFKDNFSRMISAELQQLIEKSREIENVDLTSNSSKA